MGVSLHEANSAMMGKAAKSAYQDMGLEYNARPLTPPADDEELQAILAREKELLRDEKVPANIRKEQQHLDAIDQKIEDLIYKTEITADTIYELGLLTVLLHHHLERIDGGDKNPIANELIGFFRKLKN